MKLTLMKFRTPTTNYFSGPVGKAKATTNYEVLIYEEKTSVITPFTVSAPTYEDLIREILREVSERIEVKK